MSHLDSGSASVIAEFTATGDHARPMMPSLGSPHADLDAPSFPEGSLPAATATGDQARTKIKRTKLGRYTAEITKDEIEKYFHMPSEEACKLLGVGLTILKRLCRRFGIKRWPYRRVTKSVAKSKTEGAGKRQTSPSSPLGGPNEAAQDGASIGGSSSGGVLGSQEMQLQQQYSGSARTAAGASHASAGTGRRSSDGGTTTSSLLRAGSDRATVECDELQRGGSLKRGWSSEVASSSPGTALPSVVAAVFGAGSPTAGRRRPHRQQAAQRLQQPSEAQADAAADLLADELGAHCIMRASSLKKRRSVEQDRDPLAAALLLEQEATAALPATAVGTGPAAPDAPPCPSSKPAELNQKQRSLQLQAARSAHQPQRQPGLLLQSQFVGVSGTAGNASGEAVARWQEQQLAAITALVAAKEPTAAALLPSRLLASAPVTRQAPVLQHSQQQQPAPQHAALVQPAQRQQQQQQEQQCNLVLSPSDAMLASFPDSSPLLLRAQGHQNTALNSDSGYLLHSVSGSLDPLGWDRGEGKLDSGIAEAAASAPPAVPLPPSGGGEQHAATAAHHAARQLIDSSGILKLISPFSTVSQGKPENEEGAAQLLGSLITKPPDDDVSPEALPSAFASLTGMLPSADPGSTCFMGSVQMSFEERSALSSYGQQRPVQLMRSPFGQHQQQQRATLPPSPLVQPVPVNRPQSAFVPTPQGPTPVVVRAAAGPSPTSALAGGVMPLPAAAALAQGPDPDLLALQQMWRRDIDLIMHDDDIKKLMADLQASERVLPPLPPLPPAHMLPGLRRRSAGVSAAPAAAAPGAGPFHYLSAPLPEPWLFD